MSTWLKKWSAQVLVFTVMVTSSTLLSAASIERSRCLENESYQTMSKSDAVEDDISPDILYYGRKALLSLLLLSKEGLRIAKSALQFVWEHPGKALALALALQNKTSSFSIPSAEAQYVLSVTNLNQNITSSNATVRLLPMTISGSSTTVSFLYPMTIIGGSYPLDAGGSTNVTFVLNDAHAGNITANCYANNQTFFNGVWNTYGFNYLVDDLLACLDVTRTPGYFDTIYITSMFIDQSNGENTAQGSIQLTYGPIVPSSSGASQLPLTTNGAQSTITITSISQAIQSPGPAIQTSSSILTATSISTLSNSPSTESGTMSSRITSYSKGSINATNDSSVTHVPTSSNAFATTTSTSNAFSPPFVASTNDPSYAIFGGAIGGGLVICSIVAGIIVYVRACLAKQREFSPSNEHNQDSGMQHPSHEVRSPDYGLIVVAQPQNLKPSEYDDLSAVSSRSQGIYSQPDSTSGYGSLSLAPMEN